MGSLSLLPPLPRSVALYALAFFRNLLIEFSPPKTQHPNELCRRFEAREHRNLVHPSAGRDALDSYSPPVDPWCRESEFERGILLLPTVCFCIPTFSVTSLEFKTVSVRRCLCSSSWVTSFLN